MPTYPISPTITVNALLKQPRLISRALTNLTAKRFIADKVFQHGSPDEVAGGSMVYQRSESIYLDAGQDVEEIAARGDWPRAGWSDQIFTELVKQFGLEIPISNLALRRNQMSQMILGQRRLANNLVRFVDSQAISLLKDTTKNPTIQTYAAPTAWATTATAKIAADVAAAQELVDVLDEGYDVDTLILHVSQRPNVLDNADLSNRLPRETTNGMVQTGVAVPFLGLDQILFTNQIGAHEFIALDQDVTGTIADEQPDSEEGFVAYDPGDGQAPIWVKVYEEGRGKDKIIAAGRWPGMILNEPRAVVWGTGI